MTFEGKRVSVVIPAYNEEKAIAKVVKDFSLPFVDEIVVVDNNSKDKTGEIAKSAGAIVVKEPRQGYGFSCRRALESATGDIIILTEADNTFDPRDAEKMLSHMSEADMIIGTRTHKPFIENGANSNPMLLYGNMFIAKLLQLFYGGVKLTDVGCTMRVIKKDALRKIINKFRIGGSEFSPEMIIEAIKAKLRIVEIPVHYRKRIGQGKITSASNFKAFRLGLKMIRLIISRKFS